MLTGELGRLKELIRGHAIEYGLDFFDVVFELVDAESINSFAALGGFPIRYPHWRFGMNYERLSKGYEWGLQKIYEMVINTDPCYAYLMRANNLVDQKTVIAHVYGHADFFKNNYCFKHTNRKMLDTMANHAIKVRRMIDKYGIDDVESFLDVCLSLENLIDIDSPHIPKEEKKAKEKEKQADPFKFAVERSYLDSYMNPKEYVDKRRKELEQKQKEEAKRFPLNPERDVLKFLIEHAPIEDWQVEILSMVREEMYYFAPQGQTKIMNEGWASFWHSKIMTEKALTDEDVVDYCDHCAGVFAMAPGSFNPYKVGVSIFRDILYRWDTGRFGPEYENCDNYVEKRNWFRPTNLGMEKIFEVRKYYNDVTFIDEFLTPELMDDLKLYNYGFNRRTNRYEITSRDPKLIKDKLLNQLTNFGQPRIEVINGNYENRGELLLRHHHYGVDLQVDYGRATLENLFHVWQRPVNIYTIIEKEKKILGFDGKEHKTIAVSGI